MCVWKRGASVDVCYMQLRKVSGTGKMQAKAEKYDMTRSVYLVMLVP